VSRRRWLFCALAPAVAGIGVLAYARFVEPRWLRVRAWEVQLPGLKADWDGYRIVQLSDIHVGGPGVRLATLRRAVQRAVGLRPDLVCLTGDFMHRGRWQLSGEWLFEPLVEQAPTYAVLGNHDHLASAEDAAIIADSLRRQGVTVLSNESAFIGPPGAEEVVVGLDDPVSGYADLAASVQSKAEGKTALLLLTHAPDVCEQVPRGWFRLALAGHTHGAQIRLSPFKRLSWLQLGLSEISSEYPRGFYDLDGMQLYVNQGLGMSVLPFRLGARPEVTLLVLRCDSGSKQGPRWRPIVDG